MSENLVKQKTSKSSKTLNKTEGPKVPSNLSRRSRAQSRGAKSKAAGGSKMSYEVGKLPLYSIDGVKTGTLDAPKEVFGVVAHADLIHQAVIAAQANRRKPYAHTKDRGDVRGGGKKPWRQKGTGRARHGSIRSPLWKGGGVTFGPRKEEVLKKALPNKMRQKAFLGVLSNKANSGDVAVVESLSFPELKTKLGARLINTIYNQGTVMVFGTEVDGLFMKVLRNIDKVRVGNVGSINILDILNYRSILFSKSALEQLIKTHGRTRLVQ